MDLAAVADVLDRIEEWDAELARLHDRFADCFPRSEPRERAPRYVWGLLAPLERKNGWTLAEGAGDGTPDGKHACLSVIRAAEHARKKGLRPTAVVS